MGQSPSGRLVYGYENLTDMCFNDTEEPALCPYPLCAEDSNNYDEYKDFYEMAQFITGLIFYPAICFPGLVGNILTIVVLSQKGMRTSTNVFLLTLAVSDALKIISDIHYILVSILFKVDINAGKKVYAYLYPYLHYFFGSSVCVSSWLTVSVAVERYIMVCHATRAKTLCTIYRARVVSASVFVLMMLLTLPSIVRYETVTCFDRGSNDTAMDVVVTELWQNETFARSNTWGQTLLRSVIPLVILVVLNTCIINSLRKTRANRRMAQRNRITVMMIAVIIVFLVCITPDAIMSTVFGYGYHDSNYLVKGVREITDTLLGLNAALNFVIYCCFNTAFRQNFIAMCCKSCGAPGEYRLVDQDPHRKKSSAPSTRTVSDKATNTSVSNGLSNHSWNNNKVQSSSV